MKQNNIIFFNIFLNNEYTLYCLHNNICEIVRPWKVVILYQLSFANGKMNLTVHCTYICVNLLLHQSISARGKTSLYLHWFQVIGSSMRHIHLAVIHIIVIIHTKTTFTLY